MTEKARAMRHDLFEDVVKRYDGAETGAVIVEATLCRKESCFLLVDTGAMAVTVPSSMVEALGLSDRLGKEVQATVAGGGRIRGRELTIPQLSVLGMEAEDVRAIVLDEFDAGVDGSLGLSYLKRFDVRIGQSHKEKLIIEPRAAETDAAQ
jgi:aspartyl protease family protein